MLFIRFLKKKFVYLIICLLIFFVSYANAAVLSISPSNLKRATGNNFTVSVYVDTVNNDINAISGDITFPANLLRVNSLAKTGSIVDLWVQEPSFSNSAGTVHFEGIALNPGYTGSAGKIIDINFRALRAGNADVDLISGSVLANDGKGTSLSLEMKDALVQIQAGTSSIPGTSTIVSTTIPPEAPFISSPSHPAGEAWYKENKVNFNWSIPVDVSAIGLSFNQNASGTPEGTASTSISHELSGVADGTWYLHLRLRNNAGWSDTSHFRVNIDSIPPEPFVITFLDGKNTKNREPRILFGSRDSGSGISKYEVFLNDTKITEVPVPPDSPYYTIPVPVYESGQKTVRVLAYDKAGNMREALDTFIFNPSIFDPIAQHPIPLILSIFLIGLVIMSIFGVQYMRKDRMPKIETPADPHLNEKIEKLSATLSAVKNEAQEILDVESRRTLFIYIKDARKAGISEIEIRKNLGEAGWAEADINAAFKEEEALRTIIEDVNKSKELR